MTDSQPKMTDSPPKTPPPKQPSLTPPPILKRQTSYSARPPTSRGRKVVLAMCPHCGIELEIRARSYPTISFETAPPVPLLTDPPRRKASNQESVIILE